MNIVCMTGKDKKTMVKEGGVAYWKASGSSLDECKSGYVIAIRNRRSNWCNGPEKHREPFLIGKYSGYEVEPESKRKIIKISHYAVLNKIDPIMWKGASPIHYLKQGSIESLGIKTDELTWIKWEDKNDTKNTDTAEDLPLSLEQAKIGLALTYGVEPKDIKITIEL